jgi:hypothetical protein
LKNEEIRKTQESHKFALCKIEDCVFAKKERIVKHMTNGLDEMQKKHRKNASILLIEFKMRLK